jgi:hypothetical protein
MNGRVVIVAPTALDSLDWFGEPGPIPNGSPAATTRFQRSTPRAPS